MAAPYPPTVSCVIASGDNLYPAGPVPLPVAEGGHASGRHIPTVVFIGNWR